MVDRSEVPLLDRDVLDQNESIRSSAAILFGAGRRVGLQVPYTFLPHSGASQRVLKTQWRIVRPLKNVVEQPCRGNCNRSVLELQCWVESCLHLCLYINIPTRLEYTCSRSCTHSVLKLWCWCNAIRICVVGDVVDQTQHGIPVSRDWPVLCVFSNGVHSPSCSRRSTKFLADSDRFLLCFQFK